MNPYLEKLYYLAKGSERRILGLMSGTSLDGLDMALARFSGSGFDTKVVLEKFHTYPYPESFKERIRKVYSKNQVDLSELCLFNEWLGREHGRIILRQLALWGISAAEIDIIASHGQTVYHAPKTFHHRDDSPNGSLQMGDGDHLAQTTQIITLSDFRQKQLAAGGEGAPLAPYGDSLLYTDTERNRILINIGGISNYTFLPSLKSGGRVESSDLGPGNTLMDRYVQANFPGLQYDEGGKMALSGKMNQNLFEKMVSEPFFQEPFPKSTGPELFNLDWLANKLENMEISKEDILSTLNHLTSESIFLGIKKYLNQDPEIYLSGGGMYNFAMVQQLEERLGNIPLHSTEELGIFPDAKEAVLFGLLANECIAGKSDMYFFDSTYYPKVSMGKISLPN